MRLLLVTQMMDKDDPVLGFMHRWVSTFSHSFESIEVVCLKEGKHALPLNVDVYSLGKESASGPRLWKRLRYTVRFLRYIVQNRRTYDVVLVHMNQEYILLAGWLWWLFGKPVYLWRNHYQGSFLTHVASLFSRKVFCTSKHSYTARFKKTVLMPVGVDTDFFQAVEGVAREPNSLLFLARIAPSKHPDELIDALGKLEDTNFKVRFYGDSLPEHQSYYEKLKNAVHLRGLPPKVSFEGGIPNDETPEVYSAHEIFVNLSDSGMFDKTIFEAMACGCVVVARSEDLRGVLDERQVVQGENLSQKLQALLDLSDEEKDALCATQGQVLQKHTLKELARRLKEELS